MYIWKSMRFYRVFCNFFWIFSLDKACIQQKCKDPCPGVCGSNARCSVYNHVPTCTCIEGKFVSICRFCTWIICVKCSVILYFVWLIQFNGFVNAGYEGNPFTSCNRIPEQGMISDQWCSKLNSLQKVLVCLVEWFLVSFNFKLIFPFCLSSCVVQPVRRPTDPCQPTPCGPNSQCRDQNGVAVCSCLVGYIGSPPNCRPECVVNSDCSALTACKSQKCIDPCPGVCAPSADCRVINHSPSKETT